MGNWHWKELGGRKMICYTDKYNIAFQIDEEYWEVLKHYRTNMCGKYVAITLQRQPYLLHRFLFGKAPEGLVWDHINRDKLDNRRSNLRTVSYSLNVHNGDLRPDNKSGIKGVYWYSWTNRWNAQIRVQGKLINLGYFLTIEEAASKRKETEKKYFGTI